MKKILSTFFIILIILVNIPFTYSLEDKKNDTQTVNYLIKYVDTKIDDLIKIRIKYDLDEDQTIKERIKELEDINNILIKTQKTGEYNEYIKKIVEKLKQNNNLIKIHLKEKIQEQRDDASKYTVIYHEKIKPVLVKIDDIVINIAAKLMKKEKINSKDKQIIGILVLIKQKLDRLEDITEQSFNTTKDLREYIMSNFKQITFHFGQIKNIVKQ